jgi:hypothetical protein
MDETIDQTFTSLTSYWIAWSTDCYGGGVNPDLRNESH